MAELLGILFSIAIALAAIGFFINLVLYSIAFIILVLNRLIRKPLVEFCLNRGQSASPWLLLIWESLCIFGLGNLIVFDVFIKNQISLEWLTVAVYEWFLIAMAVLPFIILLLKTRVIYFIPVLLIKILCIPLDIVYAITGGFNKSDYIPVSGRSNNNRNGGNGNYNPTNYKPNNYNTNSSPLEQTYNYSQNNSQNQNGGMPGNMSEKYGDQYRASQSSEGDGYSTVNVGGEKAYYNGDYVPYGAEGDIRKYDDGYAPLD